MPDATPRLGQRGAAPRESGRDLAERAHGGQTSRGVRRPAQAYLPPCRRPPQISVVIPCLDEEEAVGAVVDQAWEGIERSGRTVRSSSSTTARPTVRPEIAAAHGATVVSEPRRGYGQAYLTGLENARGEYVVMADADGTYPLNELGAFVDALESGDDLVLGSRFEGRIHEGAMPWSNRWIGNPILTGMLNRLFGIRVSDAHCGMRALSVAPRSSVLDLHSTGMEFASEMVFKAFRRKLTVGEIPIDYYARTGESKLSRFGDAWRHVRFMLLYSPSWLFFVPGGFLLLLGFAGMLVLASGPVDVFGRTWQIHTMLAFVALTLIGAQVDPARRLRPNVCAGALSGARCAARAASTSEIRLEHGLLLGARPDPRRRRRRWSTVFLRWAHAGFGALGDEYPTALAVTLFGLGVQTIFGSFFIGLLTMRSDREATAPSATARRGRARMPTHA